jgi:X-Pro dipeptidyl-peptidase
MLRLVTTCLLLITSAVFGQEKSVPIFKDGEAQPVPGFSNKADWIRHELWVETESNTDGNEKMDRVHVAVVRQKQTETEGLKVPVIYATSPYFAGTLQLSEGYMWDPKHELGVKPEIYDTPPHPEPRLRPGISNRVDSWVPYGFAAVYSSSPGTGLSEGCPTVGGKNEALAPKAVIDWLNGRAKGFTTVDGNEEVKATWCTGKVGMTGTSYNGTLPLAAATTGVEGLEAIIPIAPNTSYYHYYRSNGLVRHPGGYMGEDIDVLYNFIHTGGDKRAKEFCDCEVRDKLYAENRDRATGDYNEFWEGRDYLNQLDNLKAATLMGHAFNDWNVVPEHSVRIYEAIKKKGDVPCMAFFHQWGHGGPPPRKMMNRWFTRYVYGVENGVENDPRSWIVREGQRQNEAPTPYPDYPHPEAKHVAVHPGQGGDSHGTLTAVPLKDQGQEKFTDDVSFTGSKLAQASMSPHRLLYLTKPLTEPVHISGTPKVKIRMACSKAATNLSVWMVSLPWSELKHKRDLTPNIITRGWADPQNRDSIRESKPLVPGEFVDVTFDLQPDDQIIPVGQQIGLMIFASDREFTLWPKAGTEVTVDLDGTELHLPVVGGVEAFARANK